jgi:hypothetical protein
MLDSRRRKCSGFSTEPSYIAGLYIPSVMKQLRTFYSAVFKVLRMVLMKVD